MKDTSKKEVTKSKGFAKARRREIISGYLFVLPNFVGFFIFMMIPIVMGFIISLTNYDGFTKMDFVGLKNYIAMFKDDYFIVSVKNNFLYTLVTVPVTLVLSTLLAVALNTGIKGSSLFKTMYFFPYITSMVAIGIIWTLLFNPTVGPINNVLRAIGIANPPKWLLSTKSALWAVMIVAIWKGVGYYMVMILAGLQGIPKQLYEAAEVDGVNIKKTARPVRPANNIFFFFKLLIPFL